MNQYHSGSGDNILGNKYIISFFSIIPWKPLKFLVNGLTSHSLAILNLVRLDEGFKLNKEMDFSQFDNTSEGAFIVSGKPGSGKTHFIKEFLKVRNPRAFIFRGSEFSRLNNINDLFKSYGGYSLVDFTRILSKKEYKGAYIIIDSAEQLLDTNNLECINEFLYAIKTAGANLVFTAREEYRDNLKVFLSTINIDNYKDIYIDILDVSYLKSYLKEFSLIIPEDIKLIELLRIPFYLYLYSKLGNGSKITLREFRDEIWKRKIGLFEHQEAFMKIVVERASKLTFFTNCTNINKDILEAFENKGVLWKDTQGYAISFDIYEEWGLVRYIDTIYQANSTELYKFFSSLDRNLPMRRAFRLWLNEISDDNGSIIQDILAYMLKDVDVESFWKDELLLVVLNSDSGKTHLQKWKETEKNFEENLLQRIIYLVQLTGKVSDTGTLRQLLLPEEFKENETLFLRADGKIWDNLIGFFYENIQNIKFSVLILNLLKEYVSAHKSGLTAKYCGLIALHQLNKLNGEKGKYRLSGRDEYTQELGRIMFSVAGEIKEEINEILNIFIATPAIVKKVSGPYYGSIRVANNLNELTYYSLILILLKEHIYFIKIAENFGEKILEVMEKCLYLPGQEEDQLGDMGCYFGVNDDHDFTYHPASAFQSPFYWVLKTNTVKALDFFFSFINKTVDEYVKSRLDGTIDYIELNINGKLFKYYHSERLYSLYRGYVPAPNIIESIHMALEKFLLEVGKSLSEELLTMLCKSILVRTNSISALAVIVSVCLAFPEKTREVFLILISNKEIFEYDLRRFAHDSMIHMTYSIGLGLDKKNEFLYRERVNTCQDEHRKRRIEDVLIGMQFFKSNKDKDFEDRLQKIHSIFDKHFNELESNPDTDWYDLLNRIDLRRVTIETRDLKESIEIKFNPKDSTTIQRNDAHILVINKKNEYLNLQNYIHQCIKHGSTEDACYAKYRANKRTIFNEFHLFLEDKDLFNDLLFAGLPINLAYLAIRDYLEILDKEDIEQFENIILDYSEDLLERVTIRGYRSEIDDGVSLLALVELLGKTNDTSKIGRVRHLIFEVFIQCDLHFFSQYIIGNENEYGNVNLMERIAEIELGLFEAILWGFPYFRHIDRSIDRTLDTKKLNGKYGFELKISEKLDTYDTDVNNLLSGAIDFYKSYFFENINETEEFIIIYTYALIPDSLINGYLDVILNISETIFRNMFDPDESRSGYYDYGRGFSRRFIRHILLQKDKETVKRMLDPFFKNVKIQSQNLSEFLSDFILIQDTMLGKTYVTFWYIWGELFFAKLIILFQEKHSDYFDKDIIKNYLLAWDYWREGSKQWISLKKENSSFYDSIIPVIGTNKYTLYALSKILYTVGSNVFMEEGIHWIYLLINNGAQCNFKDSSHSEEVHKANMIYYIEGYLRRYLYKNTQKIKHDTALKKKVLKIMDSLVEEGSSVAYLLRETI